MAQPRSWTNEVVSRLEQASVTVTPKAVTKLETIITRGQAKLAESTHRQLTEPDRPPLREHVDMLATRLVEAARDHGVDILTEDTTDKLWSLLCPGFYPWC